MIVRKIVINSERYDQKIWVPKRRNIIDVIKFRGRPHIVFESPASSDLEFENAVIIQTPENKFIRKDCKYLGYWSTAAYITYVYLKPERQ